MNPCVNKKKVSLRVRNFETSKMKVSRHQSNPVAVAAGATTPVINAGSLY